MIRLLLLTIFIFLLYMGFSFVNKYDTTIHMQFMDYSIVVSSFFLLALMVLVYIVVAFVLKILGLIINAPSIFSSRIKTSKLQHNLKQVLESYSLAATDDWVGAAKLIGRIKNDLQLELAQHPHIILSNIDPNPEQRTYHLRYLMDSSQYKAFAAKELARYFLGHKYYQQGLDYAVQALNYRSDDVDLLDMLIKFYAEMMMWDEFEETISKLRKLDPAKVSALSSRIAYYYFAAAKAKLADGMDDKAKYYLEKALTYKVDLLEAIDLLVALSTNSGNSKRNIEFLEAAFAASPSFELFLLYKNARTANSDEIYSTLALLADPQKYLGLFIAIASFLDLYDPLERLKSMADDGLEM